MYMQTYKMDYMLFNVIEMKHAGNMFCLNICV